MALDGTDLRIKAPLFVLLTAFFFFFPMQGDLDFLLFLLFSRRRLQILAATNPGTASSFGNQPSAICWLLTSKMTRWFFFWYGPSKGAASEITLVRQSGLLQLLPSGKKLLADGGFRGEDKQTARPYSQPEIEAFRKKNLLQKVREAKQFNKNVFSNRWRVKAFSAG